MKKRFTEEQIIGFLREADAGLAIKELCRRHGFSEASYYPVSYTHLDVYKRQPKRKSIASSPAWMTGSSEPKSKHHEP